MGERSFTLKQQGLPHLRLQTQVPARQSVHSFLQVEVRVEVATVLAEGRVDWFK
jgi:hypothetical protein